MSARDYYLSDDPEAILAAMAVLRAGSGGRVTKAEGANPRTRRPARGGILCGRIFGDGEDERWGHIEVPAPLLHPGLRPLIAGRLGCAEDALSKVAHRAANLHDDGSVVLARRGDYGMLVFDDPEQDACDARGLEYLHRRLGDQGDRLMPRWLPVTPPSWRDSSRDPQNDAFRRVINRANRLQRLLELNAPKIINDNEERLLLQAFERLFETVRAELTAREGGGPR